MNSSPPPLPTYRADLGPYAESVLTQQRPRLIERIWQRDTSLWTDDKKVADTIRNRLGWLEAGGDLSDQLSGLSDWAQDLAARGLNQAVLLGMGGSSLTPQVLAETQIHPADRFSIGVLDSTSPDQIREVEAQTDLSRSLFIVASKSGTTTETEVLHDYFYQRLATHSQQPGQHFIAITDPGTPLQDKARQQNFQKVFLNPQDIGGRFSALSFFGLVPASLLGLDIKTILGNAAQAAARNTTSQDSAAYELGTALGVLATLGRDKLTLIVSPDLAPFGAWLEQLISESTGKNGHGIVVVEGEIPGAAEVYGPDRVFVSIRTTAYAAEHDNWLAELAACGHPCLVCDLSGPTDLYAEFFNWELATAVAGSMLGVNPFDEPNVAESKAITRTILTQMQSPKSGAGSSTHTEPLKSLLDQLSAGHYFAIHAYLPRKPELDELFQRIRTQVRDRYRVATTLGYGPRYLHSTGQLHKGGPATGVFLQITSDAQQDIAIPDQAYSFGQLLLAQAAGDREALRRRGRKLLHIHLGRDWRAGLSNLARDIAGICSNPDTQ